jgi:hypothetical protein
VRTFDNKGGESSLGALVDVICAVCGWGLVHPVKLDLLFDGFYSKFLSAWDVSVYFEVCLFGSGAFLTFELSGS